MARQGYVQYGSRRKKKKSLVFFIVSLITIIVVYVIARQIFTADTEPAEMPAGIGEPTEVVEAPSLPDVRTAPEQQQPRAVVTPVAPEPIEEKDPSAVIDDIKEDIKPEKPESPLRPERTAETILGEEIEQTKEIARAGNVIEARDKLNTLLQRNPDSPQRLKIKEMLTSLADKWLFSDEVLQGDELTYYYTVQRGDTLGKIGADNDVPWEFLLKINNILRPERLREGQRIKVVRGPFNAVITRSNFIMDLYLDDIYVKSYKIGLGSTEHETPTGLWVVGTDKLVAPSWTDPDTGRVYDATDDDYPLGSRWVGLRGVAGNAVGRTGFALHGTNEPDSIGQRSSRGCVRLSDEDILEVYDLMMPRSSQIQIVD